MCVSVCACTDCAHMRLLHPPYLDKQGQVLSLSCVPLGAAETLKNWSRMYATYAQHVHASAGVCVCVLQLYFKLHMS